MDQIYATLGPITAVNTRLRHRHHRQRRRRRHHGARAGRDRRADPVSSAATSCPQEDENWSPDAVWKHLRYRADRALARRPRRASSGPYTHYCVGGNTKFWGSVLYRLRREDFEAVEHVDGISPAWPIDYDTLAPYYDRAERLYHVHGQHGLDPTEPPRGPFPYPAGSALARRWRRSSRTLRRQGLHPSPLPLGLIRPGEEDGCICATPAIRSRASIHAKSDAESAGSAGDQHDERRRCGPTRFASRLITDASGRRVEAVEVERDGEVAAHRRVRCSSCRAAR